MQRLSAGIILLSGWRRAFVAFIAGALAVLGQAPFDFPLACFVSFPILVWLLDGATAPVPASLLGRLRPAFAIGWWFGFGYFLAGLWWVGSAVLIEADTYAWALPFVVVGLPLLLAPFFAIATAIARLLWSDGIGRIFAMAFAFGLMEWLRQFVLTGFPWNPLGFAAMPVPLLMQSVAVVGPIGMNILAVLVFCMPALLAGPRHRTLGAAIALALTAAHVGYGIVSMRLTPEGGTTELAVRIVQPNIDLTEKWDGAVRDRVFKTTLDLSSKAPERAAEKPELIVWPETSVPYLFSDRPDALAAMGAILQERQILLAGAVRTEGSGDAVRYYNSVVAIDPSGAIVDAVDKIHLVPFGEYLPFAGMFARLGVSQIVAGPMTYEAGTDRHAIALAKGVRALPYICYEIIFPYHMPTYKPGSAFILNVTNDAWFGDTPGPYQHLRQAQIRAVETGMPVVRAANTGISAAIDDKGRVMEALSIGSRGVIDVLVRIPNDERSVHYSAMAFILAILSSVGAVALAGVLRLNFK